MKLRNTSTHGDVDIVGVGPVKAGATFEAAGAVAESLIAQGFPRVDKPKPKTAKAQPEATATRRSSTTPQKEQ